MKNLLDERHDTIAREMIPGDGYTTVKGGVFYVMKVDQGDRDFWRGRRPAQALVFFMSVPSRSAYRESRPYWLTGSVLEALDATRIS